MPKCDCYHTRKKNIYGHTGFGPYSREITVGECWGTKEREECTCGGFTNKCDFYPEKRNEINRQIGCTFCNETVYVKVIQYAAPILAPLTPEQELRDRLADMTGEVYARVESNYCPVCGKRRKL